MDADDQPIDDTASLLAETKETLRQHVEKMEARAAELRELKERRAALRDAKKK